MSGIRSFGAPLSERLPRVEIDRAALAGNWQRLAAHTPGARTGAAVKADGYGLGAAEVARTLHDAGCRDFFVAWAEEGAVLRETLGGPDTRIMVLQGLDSSAAALCRETRLSPVLSTPDDIAVWREAGAAPAPAFIQLETGMNRLGLGETDARAAATLAASGALSVTCVMSHLASADEASEQSREQRTVFERVAGLFPGVPRSLANSAGILLGPEFHYDLTRPGIALYGGTCEALEGLRPVATLTAAILQIRMARCGEAAGYGAAAPLARDTRIATVGLGYADGFLRAGSGAGVAIWPGRSVPTAFLGGRAVPILGRISMDLILLDITDLPADAVRPGDRAEFYGKNVPIEQVAAAAGTIPYELLTGLGPRVARDWR
ncbi:alanine racemase [Aureimonas sp. SA4125]|uniref:alanine racemase n=1 Tax=Aureimonas sp. SA4125 TaxID=2826993 RepID=UPI001CC3FA26|nr:alanine racemase [Aureimonas sp. SA4125]BDA84029.1 alanine racemase [Aureimonas sp. SA4125]